MNYCQLDSWKKPQWIIDKKQKLFSIKCIWKYRLQNGGFCPASIIHDPGSNGICPFHIFLRPCMTLTKCRWHGDVKPYERVFRLLVTSLWRYNEVMCPLGIMSGWMTILWPTMNDTEILLNFDEIFYRRWLHRQYGIPCQYQCYWCPVPLRHQVIRIHDFHLH